MRSHPRRVHFPNILVDFIAICNYFPFTSTRIKLFYNFPGAFPQPNTVWFFVTALPRGRILISLDCGCSISIQLLCHSLQFLLWTLEDGMCVSVCALTSLKYPLCMVLYGTGYTRSLCDEIVLLTRLFSASGTT